MPAVRLQRVHRPAQGNRRGRRILPLPPGGGQRRLRGGACATGDSFLAAPGFVNDFNELYTYYKNTRLLQLAIRDGKLLASFQIGERITDIRVFRWSISSDGSEVRYIDNRGERDIALPAPFDFEWQRATREMVVEGRFPHLNILDTLFVETIGGDLTIKVENNTEVGLGIYREEVMDKTQSLDDAQVEFARLGSLLLLKVLPYREEQWRYLVFNSLTGKVERIDAIGLACIQLPEDHGIIFPAATTCRTASTAPSSNPWKACASSARYARPTARTCSTFSTIPSRGGTCCSPTT